MIKRVIDPHHDPANALFLIGATADVGGHDVSFLRLVLSFWLHRPITVIAHDRRTLSSLPSRILLALHLCLRLHLQPVLKVVPPRHDVPAKLEDWHPRPPRDVQQTDDGDLVRVNPVIVT